MGVVFLHGLESSVNPTGVPVGRKANYLRERFGAVAVALDTSVAQAVAAEEVRCNGAWRYPYGGYEDAFATPIARARDAIGPTTQLVVASSFGGAVALRLMHEVPDWRTPVIMLAGAGPKLTPYRSLGPDVRILLVHGSADTVVPPSDSEALANTSDSAQLVIVNDDHRLSTVVNDALLGRWVGQMMAPNVW